MCQLAVARRPSWHSSPAPAAHREFRRRRHVEGIVVTCRRGLLCVRRTRAASAAPAPLPRGHTEGLPRRAGRVGFAFGADGHLCWRRRGVPRGLRRRAGPRWLRVRRRQAPVWAPRRRRAEGIAMVRGPGLASRAPAGACRGGLRRRAGRVGFAFGADGRLSSAGGAGRRGCRGVRSGSGRGSGSARPRERAAARRPATVACLGRPEVGRSRAGQATRSGCLAPRPAACGRRPHGVRRCTDRVRGGYGPPCVKMPTRVMPTMAPPVTRSAVRMREGPRRPSL